MPPLSHSRLLDEETRSLLLRSALVKGGVSLCQQEQRGGSTVAGS